ncbi:MAG: GxxExxY protein [bacterium]
MAQSIIEAFYTVYNYYGYGLSESIYAGAPEYVPGDRGPEAARELALAVSYQGRHVAWQRLNAVVDRAVIVEVKTVERVSAAHEQQGITYLRASRFAAGLPLNFGPSAKFRRFIDSPKHNREPPRHSALRPPIDPPG